jgi:predicted DNA-binding transcriptional regulator YafY
MMAFDSNKKRLTTFRVDRMKNAKIIPEAREGRDEFEKINIDNYLNRSFSMYHGKDERVEIQFLNFLLDAAIDKFGKENVHYRKVDDRHFSVSAHVEVSDQFFAWVSGFGKKAKIIAPQSVIQEYKDFLDKIRNMYN